MRFGKWILAYLFDCVHRHTTWPHCDSTGLDYICCLDCGRELPYSTRRMSIVSKEERMEDRCESVRPKRQLQRLMQSGVAGKLELVLPPTKQIGVAFTPHRSAGLRGLRTPPAHAKPRMLEEWKTKTPLPDHHSVLPTSGHDASR